MVRIDPEQTANKLIHQRADVCGSYNPFTVRIVGGQIALCTSTYCPVPGGAMEHRQKHPHSELKAAEASGFKLRK